MKNTSFFLSLFILFFLFSCDKEKAITNDCDILNYKGPSNLIESSEVGCINAWRYSCQNGGNLSIVDCEAYSIAKKEFDLPDCPYCD